MTTPSAQVDGDAICVTIPLGCVAQDRDFGVIQLGVVAVGLIILLPDTRMFRYGPDLFLFAQSGFSILWATIGLFCFVRSVILSPAPLVLRFTPDYLHFDSGRAGLGYLSEHFENDSSRLYRMALQRRRRWSLARTETRGTSCRFVAEGPRLLIQCGDRTLDLGVGVPDGHRPALARAVRVWIDAEPTGAPEHARVAFFEKTFPSRAG